MRDSRADDFRFLLTGPAATLLLGSFLLAGYPAAAQQAAPVEIVPPVDAASASGAPPPVTTPPAPPPPLVTTAPGPTMLVPPPPPPPPPDNSIQVLPLPPVDASWIGILSADKGGFPRALWNGTARALVAAELPRLQPVASPALRDLTRRLLLTDAASPPGDSEPGGASLIELRLDRLLALGFVEPGLALLAILPDGMTSEATDRDGIELRFAANDIAGACNDVGAKIVRYQGTWWARALIACQALAGDNAKAALGQSLLADQKAPPDPGFNALIDRLGGRKVEIRKLTGPDPMKLALLAASKAKLPADALAAADLSALYGWALNAKLPPEDRLAAAERGEIYGAVTADDLAALYDQIPAPAKPAQRIAALKAKKPATEARARAVVYQIAHGADDPAQRRDAIAALLADAKQRGAFPATALLLAGSVANIPLDGATSDFAADAARVLLAVGYADKALPWIAASQSKALALLARWASGGKPPPGEAPLLPDALAELAARDPAASPGQADLITALNGALGAPVLSAATAPAGQPASGQSLGETVLTALLACANGDKLASDPAALAQAVAGLRAAGLDADARRLAIEAALDAGL
ncbi:MAG TPA: hypothetical protein VN795_08295 [Stellaceae bacterium]|nr:hypothetical protein [Stellaceae bacterium]